MTSKPAVFNAGLLRLLAGAGGLALIGVGIVNLLGIDLVNLLWVGFWLAAGLVLHDGVLAPATAALSRLAADNWSVSRRRHFVIALIAIGSLTLIALPLLGRQNAVAGNPSLIGRNYLAGWAVACLLVILGVALAAAVGRLRAKRRTAQFTTPG